MARARRKTATRRRGASERGRGWRWLALLLGAAVLFVVLRPSVTELAVRVRSVSDYRAVERHAEIIRAAARESRQDPNLLAAIMLAESSGQVDAVSSAGALGLFQLMLPTARERASLLGLEQPSRDELLSDPLLNARLGANYLRWLERRYDGDLERMLIAYNAGPGRLDGWIREHGDYARWRSTRERAGDSQVLAYARKVARYRDQFAARGVIAPSFDQPPAPQAAPALASEITTYGPPLLPPPPDVDPALAPPPPR